MADLAIRSVEVTIVSIPMVRRHELSQLSVTAHDTVIVRMRLGNGVVGIGEASTLGGPRWSEECVEGIKAVIDHYLAPAIVGAPADAFAALGVRMDAAAKRNTAAKAALETPAFDAVGQTLGVPVCQLLGGMVRRRVPVLWTLASGDAGLEIEEAQRKLDAGLHRTFKVKVGAQPPEADLGRLRRLATALDGRAELIVDVNQAWDETTCVRCLPVLASLGVRLVEQPLPAWNIAGMARLRGRVAVPLMADECVFSQHDMLRVASAAAADVVSLKLVKHGGLLNLLKVAAVAEAAGIGLYGGCLLETSVGAAAHVHCFAALRELGWGCEQFGPQIMVDDLVTTPLRYEAFDVHLPEAAGLGVTLDPDKLRHYARR